MFKNTDFKKYAIDLGEYDPIRCGSIDGTDTYPHDRGVVRAINSKYKLNEKTFGNPDNTIFIGRLHIKTNENKLIEKFQNFGSIKHCTIVRDIVTGMSKCYGFIEFDKYSAATSAVQEMHSEMIDQSEIMVEFECERALKGWKPRRLGGGFGGKRESGQLRFGGRCRPFQKPLDVKTATNFKEIYRQNKLKN